MADAGSENMLEANVEQQLSRIVKGKEIFVRMSCFPLFLIILIYFLQMYAPETSILLLLWKN